ncbi:MAG: sugar transferase [Clostridia bacterium]|nr:sugar transferase [Clostridia bacterium]
MQQKTRKKFVLRLAKLFHMLVTVGLFLLYLMQYRGFGLAQEDLAIYAAGGLLYVVLFAFLSGTYSAYAIGSSRVSILIYSHGLVLSISSVLAYAVLSLVSQRFLSPLPTVILLLAQILWSAAWCLAANRLYFRISPPRRTVVFYGSRDELHKLEEIRHFAKKFCITRYVSTAESMETVMEALEGAEVAFLANVDNETRGLLAKQCIVKQVQCYILPRVGDLLLVGADQMHTFSVPFLRVQWATPSTGYLFVKRAFDIFASLIAILLAGPFMLVTALLIKLYDGGPVLYRQVRLTKDGKEFKVLKFRSMRVDAEKDGVARLASENDDRITPVGKIIRKIRFDELPQLFNILRGDMTIVGPRPERPEIAAQYEKEIPSFGLRLQVKAGLTGYAQIYGRYNTEPLDKLKMDLIYINNMSVAEDLKLMFATVKILFLSESTEGVAEGQVTASHAEAELPAGGSAEADAPAEQDKELQNV